jgi:ribonuclease Y
VTEARQRLIGQIVDEARAEAQQQVRDIERRAQDEGDERARRILTTVMQRIAADHTSEATVTVVHLPSEEMKGRIIGREGRNIKSFEAATGVTLLIDETPQTVLVSSFDPVRREVARMALEALVTDGRIHPASIEESVAKAKAEVDHNLITVAHDAVSRLKLNGIHPDILQLLGRLRFRFSMSQNVLDHSIEVAEFCGMLASEIGLDPAVARRAGLLHDMGKSIPAENGGSHALIGAEFARRLGETPIVVNAIAAHHDEVKPETLYAGLVILADSVSAIRPGARAESMAAYVERLTKLEGIATSVAGVQQAFAIQAGREVRVLVQPDLVSDDQAREVSRQIRKRIEAELQFPGTIKVTVIREQRFTEIAT